MLDSAAANNHLEIVRHLIDIGANVNTLGMVRFVEMRQSMVFYDISD